MGELLSQLLEYEIYAGKSITVTIGTVFFVVFTLVLTRYGLRFLKKTVLKISSIEDSGRLRSAFNFVNYFVYVIMFFFILNAIGVNINMFLTTSAALFVGLGLALQKIFQDLIAGIYIMMDKTLSVGDVIHINDEVARIKIIKLRSTIAETRNRKIIVIPNRKFIDDIINNWTQDDEVIRARIDVGVYIGTDVESVRKVLLNCAAINPDVMKDPHPLVFLDQFGESSIRFILYYFIDNSFDNDRIASAIRFEIDKQFKENGIQLPVPVLRVQPLEHQGF
ncbi:mechanosensitive ion channel family protein [Flavobacterium sp. JP2137]|uniref:mechanosensitive ion channel family protein n=1 Tax=Flavobacterium sp. JP2137 TaxID=3414510 RepID=UPI003D2FA1DA